MLVTARTRLTLVPLSLLTIVAIGGAVREVQAQEPEAQPVQISDQTEFFETQIRPLFADNCFQCHSARVATPFAGLRLDSREGLLTGGDSGPAIVPGRPQDSALLERLHGRPGLMPPTGPLATEAIDAVARWIEMGAPWPETTVSLVSPDPSAPFDLEQRRATHWAWQPVTRADPPPDAAAASSGPVDAFIRSALAEQGFAPAAATDRPSLIRRLSFDLRGLPPSPAEIARFVDDESPTAYADLVDRYMASPRFGERWARHWMDLVRYSESHGSEGDPDIPQAWRYRDYLIRAFNGDVPYDQLVREHLAGDLLPTPRLNSDDRLNESIIGTAHFRLVEHGYQPVDPWEDRVKWADNQVDVVSKAFQGLTVSCARCHDHKFDAISQQDYYSLFGTLYGARPTQRAIDNPTLLETNVDALAELKGDIRRSLADIWRDEADTLAARLLDPPEPEETPDPGPEPPSAGRAAPESAEGSVLAVWRELAKVEPADFSEAWRGVGERWGSEIAERERFNRTQFETAWDLSTADYADTIGHGTGRTDTPSPPGEFVIQRRGDRVLNGIYPGGAYTHLLSSKHAGVIQTPRFTIDNDFISLRLLGGNLSFANLIIENYAVPRGGIYNLRYSPKRDEMTWGQWDVAFWKGFSAYIEFATQNDVTQFAFDEEHASQSNRPTRRGDGRSSIGVSQVLFHDQRETPRDTVVPLLHLLDASDSEEPTSRQELATLIGRQLSEVAAAWKDGPLSERQAAFFDEFVRADLLPRSLEQLVELRAPVARYRLLERDVPVARRAPGVVEEAAPDQPLLLRGNHKNLGAVVPRGFLTALDNQPYPDPGQVRLRLADRITAADNPLTARVAVNRVWRHLFGQGLVRTVDNFGRLGDPPSHPELLDYLAADFIEDGYAVKRLIRRLALSETYQMKSETSRVSLERDPDNRWLQHANLRRLDAEAIRDSILSVSGRLDTTMYGESVPVHYAARHGLTEGDPDNGPVDGDGRRSIYQEIRRNAHNPFLDVFDLPKPATTRGLRDATNVPAQSLTLLNSPFVIGQAALWGRRLAEGEAGTVDGRIDHMFLKTLARRPTAAERTRVTVYLAGVAQERGVTESLLLYDPQVWQDVAHSLFNLKEYVFVQ